MRRLQEFEAQSKEEVKRVFHFGEESFLMGCLMMNKIIRRCDLLIESHGMDSRVPDFVISEIFAK